VLIGGTKQMELAEAGRSLTVAATSNYRPFARSVTSCCTRQPIAVNQLRRRRQWRAKCRDRRGGRPRSALSRWFAVGGRGTRT
jgi:hypothetical protein